MSRMDLAYFLSQQGKNATKTDRGINFWSSVNNAAKRGLVGVPLAETLNK